jgi:hypothetical protein
VSKRLRRTISAWETAPRDGTPFHILSIVRYNPLAGQFEALSRETEAREWRRFSFAEGCEPSMWLRLVPLPYEIPTSLAFTWTYEVRRKSWWDRLTDRLLGRLSEVQRFLLVHNLRAALAHARGECRDEGDVL